MGLINIYNTLSNEHTTIRNNGILKDILPGYDFKHALCIKAGDRINEDYCVQEEDVLYLRVTPGSATAVAVVAIICAVVAVGVGVGAAVYANKQSQEAKEKMEKAQRDANNLASATNKLPFLRGAKNVNALGRNIQFLMGNVYNTPYNLTGGFYSIDGKDGVNSYYNATLSLGFGKQKVTEIMIGDKTVLSDQNGITGSQNFQYYDLSGTNVCEIRKPGEQIQFPNCNCKVSSTYSGQELKHNNGEDAEPIIVQAAENAKKIQVCIQFSCLRNYDSSASEWKEREAKVRPFWSNDGGATWNEFYFDGMSGNTIKKNVNHTIRYVATKEFTASESYGKNISIKVYKDTPKEKSGSQEDCALLWYQTFSYDAKKSSSSVLVDCTPVEEELLNKTTRAAFKFISTSSTDGILDELHFICNGMAKTWDGTSWSVQKVPTRNPASWILEILTTDVHEPSKYTESEIDLISLGDLYDYCETNHFYTDGIVTESIKKSDLISKILTTVNTDMIINSDGLLSFVIDKEESTPVALLNAETVRSINYAKEFNRKTDGTKVTFTNRDKWEVDTFYAMIDGGSYDYANDTVNSLSADYVTTYDHAYKMAQRKLRQQQLMPRTIKADVGHEGDSYPLYSTVYLQINQLLQGIRSSVITGYKKVNNQITKIKISDWVYFEEGKNYGVIIQATTNVGKKLFNIKVTGEGKTRELTLQTPIDMVGVYPEINNHLSFGLLDAQGEFTKVTNVMKIYGIEPNGDEGYTLTLKDYNEEVYSYGGAIPSYKSNLTLGQVPSNVVTINDLNRLKQEMNDLQVDLINAYQLLNMPIVVDASIKNTIFDVDASGKTIDAQRITTRITCRQGDEYRDFVLGTIAVPSGWSYTYSNGNLTFIVPEGLKVGTGQFKIPVIYRPIVSIAEYVDQSGQKYVDEDGEQYADIIYSQDSETFDIWFSYFGINEAAYLGPISTVELIPEVTNKNDYFTWSGTQNEETTLVKGGILKQGCVYKFVGTDNTWRYEEDNDTEHTNMAFYDILGISNADLEHNNSTAYEYLDHLTTNSLFTDFIVSNKVITDTLITKVVQSSDVLAERIKASEGFFDDIIVNGEIYAKKGILKEVVIQGNSKFSGEIDSGPLLLSNASPIPKTEYASAGSNISYALLELSQNYNGVGSYGSYTFTTAELWISKHYGREIYDNTLRLYYGNTLIYSNEKGPYEKSNIYILDYDMSFTTSIPIGSMTFKLRGIPTSLPSESGTVYRDSNGFLKIV